MAAVVVSQRYSNAASLGLAITRDDVVRIAREQAAEQGVKTDGWRDLVDLSPNNELRHYLATTATSPERAAIERVVAPVQYRGVLVSPERSGDFVQVTVAPSGRLISYRMPPARQEPQVSESQARMAAEEELEHRLGADRNGFTLTSSGVRRHEPSSSNVRRFTYRKRYSNDLDLEATVETSGRAVIQFSAVPKIAPAYSDRFPELGLTLKVVRASIIAVLVFAGLVYVIARFVRRLREQEIPLKRSAIVAVIVFLAFAGSMTVSIAGQQIDAIERGAGTPSGIQLTIMFAVSAVMGAALGMTWGACEADLREAYPEKLSSTDALLGGRFSSRAVRSSMAVGLALGAYAALLSSLEPLLRPSGMWVSVAEELVPYQAGTPALALAFYAFVGLPFTMAMLLTAVSATHRRGTTRAAKVSLTVLLLLFFLLSTTGNHSLLAWSIVTASIATVILLIPFFAGDVLAVVVSVTSSLWIVGSSALIAQPSAALRAGGWTLLSAMACIVAAGGIAALRKRETSGEREPEERPEYARNIAERILLRSEMDAARQAQLRVMPRTVPAVDGAQLAARHSTSAEIGSDYFEFFPSDTYVSVAVADARLPGLSSALCVSMLKGLLLNYASRLTSPRDVADRVYRQLAAIFGDDLPLSFFFGRLDCGTGAFAFATFGTAPRAVLLRGGKAVSLEGEEYVALDPSDVLVIYTARLLDLRDRDRAAIGEELLHRELSATASADPQRLVDALFELAARHSRGVETPPSWAAVAMSRQPRAQS